MPNEKAEALAT